VGQRHVECPVLQVWNANTLDLTHSTGTCAIVSLYMYEHGNSNVTKGCDKISMEGKDTAREGIICTHTTCKLEKFLQERIDE